MKIQTQSFVLNPSPDNPNVAFVNTGIGFGFKNATGLTNSPNPQKYSIELISRENSTKKNLNLVHAIYGLPGINAVALKGSEIILYKKLEYEWGSIEESLTNIFIDWLDSMPD